VEEEKVTYVQSHRKSTLSTRPPPTLPNVESLKIVMDVRKEVVCS